MYRCRGLREAILLSGHGIARETVLDVSQRYWANLIAGQYKLMTLAVN